MRLTAHGRHDTWMICKVPLGSFLFIHKVWKEGFHAEPETCWICTDKLKSSHFKVQNALKIKRVVPHETN